ncbi:phage Gp37/Gp68 family protein, partial [Pseudodesulfovibrio pelocollis]|uniref:phage Gp37/Gp68 family protein n=1 Tax=Pseudodesulfovibrio pelocollis TaxID=3051432 RepID=UPI00255B1FD0
TSLVESALAVQLRWRKPCRVFVGSMTDLFHPTVPDEWLDRVFSVMAATPHITYQVLTKRPERMREYFEDVAQIPVDSERDFRVWDAWRAVYGETYGQQPWPLPNVWLGVTAENQAMADERIPALLDTPAAVRYVSYEPALGAVKIKPFRPFKGGWFGPQNEGEWLNVVECGHSPAKYGINWLICGGESGPGARPMHPEWARGLRDQCREAKVPFFFKQWGEWGDLPYRLMAEQCVAVTPDGQVHSPDAAAFNGESLPYGAAIRCRVGKKAAGRLLDGREWNEFPGVRHGG